MREKGVKSNGEENREETREKSGEENGQEEINRSTSQRVDRGGGAETGAEDADRRSSPVGRATAKAVHVGTSNHPANPPTQLHPEPFGGEALPGFLLRLFFLGASGFRILEAFAELLWRRLFACE